jgi:uncharacterized phiE125 gp8 family phage protein
MADLTTLANLKAWLNLTATGDDALLGRLVTAASAFVENWLGRAAATTSYVETRDGTGGTTLVFAVTPVTAVTALTIDNHPIAPSPDGVAPGYVFSPSRLALIGGGFRRGLANVTVSYQAGYAATPPEIEQAVIALAALRYRERERIGLVSKGLAGETTSFAQKDMPADVATALQRYRKVVPL